MPGPPEGSDAVIRADLDRVVRDRAGELSSLAGASLLLTGGTGFVGRFLLEAVLRSNDVRARRPCVVILPTRRPDLVRARYPEAIAAGEVQVVEWGAGRALDPAFPLPDYVIHGAATTDPAQIGRDPEAAFRETVAMATSVAAVGGAARRVVLISSGAVYGEQPADLPGFPETWEPPLGGAQEGPTYAGAKRASERQFREIDGDVRIARVFSLAGPYLDLRSAFAVPDFIRQAAEREAITLATEGSARRSFCYAADLASILLWLLLGEPRHDVYNIGSRDGTASIAEVAAMIAGIFGGLEVRRSKDRGSQRDYVPDLDRLYEEFVPTVGLREGLLRTCWSMSARGVIDRRPVVDLA